MERYLLDIKADDKPVLLERVLRVIRHRGFIIKQVNATQNHESKIASVEIIVDSDRPITTLINQIEKLWDIRTVKTTLLENRD
ncbi:acetolactate synthase 2 small subunit [Photobacterium profundum]|jgi:acetolactate synthase II small subunit|uniref:Acetolactate synthase II, small subunit n=1 Tax=Photobacterium profundum 3TCK TaxID=314280 RepID=Q1YZJ7_9GAMM|nr:acetolactate synthase 2 small subunit [Photobacterium profundum]EAS41730.1 acetolactate synthase II, small subunit [Photobacterium profundum 3TCK]PSV58638.1 acetolactate synthase 2 small subunit [Photobacterium profundum]